MIKLKLKTTNKRYTITRDALDYPEGHFGYQYNVAFDGVPLYWDLSKEELNELRKKLKF